jgi:hypothetical protein
MASDPVARKLHATKIRRIRRILRKHPETTNTEIDKVLIEDLGSSVNPSAIVKIRQEFGIKRPTAVRRRFSPEEKEGHMLLEAMRMLAERYGLEEFHYVRGSLTVVQKVTRTYKER